MRRRMLRVQDFTSLWRCGCGRACACGCGCVCTRVDGQASQTGFPFLVARHRTRNTKHETRNTKHGTPDTGHRTAGRRVGGCEGGGGKGRGARRKGTRRARKHRQQASTHARTHTCTRTLGYACSACGRLLPTARSTPCGTCGDGHPRDPRGGHGTHGTHGTYVWGTEHADTHVRIPNKESHARHPRKGTGSQYQHVYPAHLPMQLRIPNS
jgi:hypothetical protein